MNSLMLKAFELSEAFKLVMTADTGDKRPVGFLVAVMAVCIVGLSLNLYIRKRDSKPVKKQNQNENKPIDKQERTRHNQTDDDE